MAESNTIGPDCFGFYANQVVELFSQDEEFLYSTYREGVSKHGNSIGVGSKDKPCPPFSNNIEAGISHLKGERLKALLKEARNVLSQEVDEMLDPALSMHRLRSKLRSRRRQLLVTQTGTDATAAEGPPTRRKMSSSSSSWQHEHSLTLNGRPNIEGSESKFVNTNSLDVNLLEGSTSTKKNCAFCNTAESAFWKDGPAGPKSLCDACGISYENGKESCVGSDTEKKNDNPELDEDFQFLLENNSLLVEEVINKQSNQLSASLTRMGNQLEELLDAITSKCRPMKLSEKQQLKKLIQKLPPQNLDRVVEIIQHRKQSEPLPCNEIFVDFDKEENKTLWRLYYYVKAVENARKLACASSSVDPNG